MSECVGYRSVNVEMCNVKTEEDVNFHFRLKVVTEKEPK